MATIQSLGLHEPTALPYLISEAILPPEPDAESYTWQSYHIPSDIQDTWVDEEIVTTEFCVVWSRNGIVKRVFDFRVEKESILHAFITDFPSKESQYRSENRRKDVHLGSKPAERALVVVLRTQAHIFILSGDGYILPLPFEVETAFPCPFGFILQQKLGLEELRHQNESSGNHDLSTINESTGTINGGSPRPSLILPTASPEFKDFKNANAKLMPRTFSFTEVLGDLGVVVFSPSRKLKSFDEYQVLPATEKLLYISANDELGKTGTPGEPLCIALTTDYANRAFTLWQVIKPSASNLEKSAQSRNSRHSRSSRSGRKSSNIYGRSAGTATPGPIGKSTFRESFGLIGQSLSENIPQSSGVEQKPFLNDDLASQLGPEFGEIGVQTRSARRVSSMLARTDLGPGNDRNTFNDFAVGHGHRRSMAKQTRRGESIGSFSDRQSLGARRRSSFPADVSIMSNGTSLLDVPGHSIVDRLHGSVHLDETQQEEISEDNTDLQREVGFLKVRSFPRKSVHSKSTSITVPKVFVVSCPSTAGEDGQRDVLCNLYLCIMDKTVQEIDIVNLLVKDRTTSKVHGRAHSLSHQLEPVAIRHGSSIADACKVSDGSIQRLLTVTQARVGDMAFQLEAPWCPSIRIDLPDHFSIFDPFKNTLPTSPTRYPDIGSSRTIPKSDIQVAEVGSTSSGQQVLLVDTNDKHHSVRFDLAPKDPLVLDVLSICDLILGSDQRESILVAFWEVRRWQNTKDLSAPSEWTVLVVVLFSIAVPFISDQQAKSKSSQQRKKRGFLRSSSGSAVDLTCWHNMQNDQQNTEAPTWRHWPAWDWLADVRDTPSSPRRTSKPPRDHNHVSGPDLDTEGKYHFLPQCAALAREFVQTPAGEASIGPEGYLPIAVNKSREIRRNALAKIVVGLHLLCEERKLNIAAAHSSSNSEIHLVLLMGQIGRWLGWKDWSCDENSYYSNELDRNDLWQFEDSRIDGLQTPPQPFPPPSIFQHIDNCITLDDYSPFPTLLGLVNNSQFAGLNTPQWKAAAQLTPRTFALLSLMNPQSDLSSPLTMTENMSRAGINRDMLDTMPDGLAAAFHQAISTRRCSPAHELDPVIMKLLEQDDLLRGPSAGQLAKTHQISMHEAIRDYHSIGSTAIDTDSLQRWDASSEIDRHTVTKLLFREDRRFQEASKLVNQTRPPIVECTPEPDWSEADILEAQKELAQFVTRRTLSVAAGRGMMHFNARMPLLTERVPIPAFSLQCVMKPRNANESSQAMTFSADKAAFTEDKVCWAFFHNGASAGLMISKDAQCIDTSWILYNKPAELTNRHAGFLLALGLIGHLKTLAKWVAFKYLTPKHTMTSIGLLLGLSASYLGSMDTLITRLLSVHVTRLLPPGAAELNLSPLTQTTGLMGIGLLYHNSQHRRMSEVMLSEIENDDPEEVVTDDTVLRDEGYRLAAGFSLGLINLGQGKHLHGLHDMNVVERLLSIAIATKNVNLVHVLDRATAGAVMAIAFIFMKTNDEAIANKIDIPDTIHQFDYVRPDIFLLRTLARHLIMWNSIKATKNFIESSLPPAYMSRADLKTTKYLSTEDMPLFNVIAGLCFAIGLRYAGTQDEPVRDLLITYLDHFLRLSKLPAVNYDAKVTLNSVRNCLDVLALATATVVAGSGDVVVMRRLRALHGRTDKDTPFGSHLAAHMALGALFLGGGTSTFGTSDLAVASLCIAFYPLFPTDILDNRGHLQALRHLWVLAVEGRCLVARNADNGNVIPGIDARIMLKTGDEKIFRSPGLLPDLDTIKSIKVSGDGYWDVLVEFTESNHQKFRKEQAIIVYMQHRATYERAPQSDIFVTELQALTESSGIPSVNPNAVSINQTLTASSTSNSETKNPFSWLFELSAFHDFDHSERALVLSAPVPPVNNANRFMKGTVVDTRLQFEKGILPNNYENSLSISSTKPTRSIQRDKLWQLKLLFAWCDRLEKQQQQQQDQNQDRDRDQARTEEDTEVQIANATSVASEQGNRGNMSEMVSGTWLRKEVIDRLRWRIWRMSASPETQGS